MIVAHYRTRGGDLVITPVGHFIAARRNGFLQQVALLSSGHKSKFMQSKVAGGAVPGHRVAGSTFR